MVKIDRTDDRKRSVAGFFRTNWEIRQGM